MAGIFPVGGIAAGGTLNAASPVVTDEGCLPLYHRVGCVPQFDPAAANALISEIINAINVVKSYDCSRLDNLADAFKYLGDLCNLPTLAELGIEQVTNADTLAGCFSDLSGRITIEDLRTVILNNLLCGLPTVTTAKETDFLAGCFDVGGTGTEGKIAISSLKALLGSGAPALIAGSRFAQSTGSPLRQNINVGSRQFLIAQAPPTASNTSGYAGRLGEFSWLWAFVTNAGNSNELIWSPQAFAGSQAAGWGGEYYPCYRIRESWYLVNKGVAFFVGSGATLVAQGTVNFFDASVL